MVILDHNVFFLNSLLSVLLISQAGVYGKIVLWQNQSVVNGLILTVQQRARIQQCPLCNTPAVQRILVECLWRVAVCNKLGDKNLRLGIVQYFKVAFRPAGNGT